MRRITLNELFTPTAEQKIVKIEPEEFIKNNQCDKHNHPKNPEISEVFRKYCQDEIGEDGFNEMKEGVVFLMNPEEMQEWLDKNYNDKNYCAGCLSNIFNEQIIEISIKMIEMNQLSKLLDNSKN